MCGACGVLGGGPDWIDRTDNPDGIGHRPGLTRGAERQRRLRLVNLLLAPGRSRLVELNHMIVLCGPTGGSAIVDSLTHVWWSVERVGARPIDVLDAELLRRLDG